MASSELEKRIAAEKAAIDNAPVVSHGGYMGRCHFCGLVSKDLALVEIVDSVERYKCEVCRGERF